MYGIYVLYNTLLNSFSVLLSFKFSDFKCRIGIYNGYVNFCPLYQSCSEQDRQQQKYLGSFEIEVGGGGGEVS